MLFKNKVEVFVLESFEVQEVYDLDKRSQRETEWFVFHVKIYFVFIF